MRKIYMDYAATSPVKPEVLRAMKPYFSEKFGNPSSIHSFGQETRHAINHARKEAADFLNCEPSEIIFTSGGTEADNLAIRGIVFNYLNSKHEIRNPKQIQNHNDKNSKRLENSNLENYKIVRQDLGSVLPRRVSNFDIRDSKLLIPHIITSAFEHHAILHTYEDLEKMGLAEATYLKPDKEGIIHVEDVEAAIKPNTVLVSIMYVNNEIGTVQPISEIAKAISEYNIKHVTYNIKKQNSKSPIANRQSPIYFHTDAVQAVEYFDCNVKQFSVDMLSLSAHKFGGPKGIGTLYVKKGTLLKPIQTGGAQESNLRAGTENVAGIVGIGKAIELISNKRQVTSDKYKKSKSGFDKNMLHVPCYMLQKLRDYFINQVMIKIPHVKLNGSKKFRSPNNVSLSFKNAEGESILLSLDQLGIAASSGSACTSGSLEPSHVLRAIGVSDEDAHGAVRFTLGESTTKEEIDYVIKNLVKIIAKLRKMSPYNYDK